MTSTTPPRFARAILRALVRGTAGEVILGDLDEEYATEVLPALGALRARRWYWGQVSGSIAARWKQKMGAVGSVDEHIRLERAWLVQDLRSAARTARRAPGFVTAVVLTLALGVGANTAIFAVVRHVLLEPPPYQDADRLVLLWNRTANSDARMRIASLDILDYRSHATLFEGFAATDNLADASLTGVGDPEHIRLGRVTSNFFSLLGVEPQIGRGLAADRELGGDDSSASTPMQIVLSNQLWRRRFGADPNVPGSIVRVDGRPAVIAGVLPPDFRFHTPPEVGLPQHVDVWAPLVLDRQRGVRTGQRVRDQDSDDTGTVVGRLRPGVTLVQARAEMATIAARQRAQSEYHRNARIEIDVYPLHEDVTAHVRPMLLALFGAVGLVLVISCLNIANLLLARGVTRQHELVLRTALGASRGRIAHQLFTESLALGIVGAGLGMLLAAAAVELLVAYGPAALPQADGISIDGATWWFAAGITLLAVVTFGSSPAYVFSRERSANLLTTRTGHRDGRGVREVLVIVEVAMAIALLVGTGLLLRTVWTLQNIHPGFEAEGVLVFDLSLRDPTRYRGPADRARFIGLLEERITSLPEIEAAGLVGQLPLSGRVWTNQYGVAGQDSTEWSANEANFRMVTPTYFEAMRTRLLAGRFFTSEENVSERRRVVIIDERMARRLPDGDPIGQRVGFPLDGRRVWAEVVGVVENVRHESLMHQSRETLYVPYRHEASRNVSMAVRVRTSPSQLSGAIREIVRDLDPGLPLHGMRTMSASVAEAQASQRFALSVLAAFAGIALALSATGLYGVLSFSVSRETHDIGVRMALGARGATVLRQVVGRGMILVGVGVVAGLALAAAGTRLLFSLLFGVSPLDIPTYVSVAIVVAAVAVTACYLPARRASRVDPLVALRYE